ncbi:MAG: hypothetical protein R3F61_24405 [Myxococcota bacterium]
MLRFMPILYGLLLALEVVGLTVLYVFATPDPSDPISVWLGTLGLLSMIVMLVYSVARRIKLLRNVARLSYWLHLHIFLGLQGFVFVCFHSLPMFTGSKFMWLNPGVLNFLAVCVVIASGIFGRWLFSMVPKTLGGQHMAAKEVEAELKSLDVDLPDSVTSLWKGLPETRSIFGVVKSDLDRRTAVRKLRSMKLEPKVYELAARRLQLERHKAALSVTQRIFKWWIILHRPIAAILYILSAVHFLLALMFTPSLRFF